MSIMGIVINIVTGYNPNVPFVRCVCITGYINNFLLNVSITDIITVVCWGVRNMVYKKELIRYDNNRYNKSNLQRNSV
jgi:hypothetical protein